MKTAIFLCLFLWLFFIGCGKTEVRYKTAGQIISNSWEGDNELSDTNWNPLAPPVIITKSDTGDVIALFVTEIIAKYGIIEDPETHKPIELIGVPVEIRIKVDDKVASPSVSTLTATPYYETRSFLASMRDVLTGTHTVIAEWHCKSTGAHVRNRSLTVWETISQ